MKTDKRNITGGHFTFSGRVGFAHCAYSMVFFDREVIGSIRHHAGGKWRAEPKQAAPLPGTFATVAAASLALAIAAGCKCTVEGCRCERLGHLQ